MISAGFGPLEFVLRSSAGRLAGSGDEGLDCLKKKAKQLAENQLPCVST